MPTLEKPTWWHAAYKDAEAWDGPYMTREHAKIAALYAGHDWIARGVRAVYSAVDLIGEHDDLIEAWADNNEEMIGPDGETPFDHWRPGHLASLRKHLRMAAAEWAAAAGVKPSAAWMFHEIDPAEFIGEPLPAD